MRICVSIVLLVKGSCPAARRAAGTVVALVLKEGGGKNRVERSGIFFGGRGKMYTIYPRPPPIISTR